MPRRRFQEEHTSHEAWAIPYGDLVTLLLAFFVVMYSISSVNAGKYRVVADSLSDAFGGPPRAMKSLKLVEATPRTSPAGASAGIARLKAAVAMQPPVVRQVASSAATQAAREATTRQLQSIGDRIGDALSGLVQQNLVHVRRGEDYLEVEIQSDLLFPSGSAAPSSAAVDTVQRLGEVLRDERNAIRVEGYTDDQQITSAAYASNWELSSARAAAVLHVLVDAGVAPVRLSMAGFGEFQPVADNTDAAGRNANRRVMLVILPPSQGADALTRAMPVAAATSTLRRRRLT